MNVHILKLESSIIISLPTVLSELQALTDEVGEYPTKKVPTWSERMEKQEESWEGFRPKILDETSVSTR